MRTFQALSPREQQLLALFTVAHQALNRTKMAELAAMAGIRGENKRAISTNTFAELVTSWLELGLIYELGERGYGRYRSSEALLHPLFALLHERGELAHWASLLRAHAPLRTRYGYANPETLERELLLGLYLEEEANSPAEFCKLADAYYRRDTSQNLLVQALGTHAPATLIRRLGSPLAERYLAELFTQSILHLQPLGDGPLEFVEAEREALDSELLSLAAAYLALRGDGARALSLCQRADPPSHMARCLIALTCGRLSEARAEAANAIAGSRAKASKKLKALKSWLSTWTTLALLTDVDPAAMTLGQEQLAALKRAPPHQEVLHTALLLLAHAVQNDGRTAQSLPGYAYSAERWDELIVWRLLARVAGAALPETFSAHVEQETARARDAGFVWLAEELASSEGGAGISALHRSEEPWQRSLRALEAALGSANPSSLSPQGAAPAERLVWTLIADSEGDHQVTARVQTAQGSGWSTGRQVSWKKLADATRDARWIGAEDLAVIEHIRPPDPRAFRQAPTPDARLPLALIGHPRVFVDPECRQPVEVARGPARLEVQANEETIQITLWPQACHGREVVCERDGSGRVLVYALTDAQRAIAEKLGKQGLVLPASAREAAERVIALMVAHFPISSELGIDAAQLEQRAADPRVHVGLARTAVGLRVRLFVAPIGPPQTFSPGEGSASVLGTVQGEHGLCSVRAVRDLNDERQRVLRLLDECPILGTQGNDQRELRIEALETCLELLSQLRDASDVVLVWSEGEPLQLAGERALRDVRLRLRSAESWLAADGELPVDELSKLTFRALLEARQQHGRFVLLDDGRYLALSNELSRTLELLAPLAKVHGEQVELHPLALLHLSELAGVLDVDDGVSSRLDRLREASERTPEVPASFQATLRPYQSEGYAWLSRLAQWGGGACLADDMGLGKTLQALALLVEHAPAGPALVVAPTSVCENWLQEARRFAPTLRMSRFAVDRERTIRELGAYDVLVCSYGLLQQEIERLEQVRFNIVILDEAQAIKNASALRTRAALRLNAQVRVALTGTPVENHLGELYSLMRFLNPGLLGTGKQFESRFAKPIQRESDRQAGQLLKRLIKPFVLRRKKSEVLDDLPPKTVITLHVEASAEEQALYAALRERALAKVAAPGAPAQARIQILAELMRLRRAACHPRLVLPDTAIASSKLAAFEELVDELRQGGHRALVFSQFVDQLTIVRQRLEELDISYQYLDGSSSPPARAQAVEAFQAGQGDLFLISLKAGGFGLNLTAADYVVHLDPWWNPAVEDQASDRAHRIGQTRPVTVYRLVMQGSIEEKILALHHDKRDLAEALLDGTGSGAALSVDELVTLLREAAPASSRAPASATH